MQPDLLLGAFSLAVLVLSIIVHEVAHGYAANALGDPTAKLAGRLTLNPLPHVDLVGSVLIPAFLVLTQSSLLFGWAKPVPYNPNNLNKSAFARRWGEFTVSIAGVATNLAIAVLFFATLLLLRYAPEWRRPVSVVVAFGLWIAMLESGVDPVISGLAAGLATSAYPPARADLERATDLTRSFREQPTPECSRAPRSRA